MGDTSNDFRGITATIRLILALACGLMLANPVAFADRVVLAQYQEQVLRDIKRAYPDWTDEQIRGALKYEPPTRVELLEGLPPSALREREGNLEIVGRVKQLIPGLHQGDPTDPLQHDKLVIETGLDGQGKTFVLSAFNVRNTFPEIDSVEDFEWLFSNRHSLAGVEPGSVQHRQILYSLVDTDGWLGLVDQPVNQQSDQVVEGAYTTYLLKGRPSQEAHTNSWNWNRGAQFWLVADPPSPDMDYGPDTVGEFKDWYTQLLWAAARARKYPGYPPGFDRWAINSLDMLCGLRFADPVLVDGAAAQVAWRARAAGHGCFASVTWGVQGGQADLANHYDPDRPISDDEITAVALDLVENSSFIREVVLNAPVASMPELRFEFTPPEVISIPGLDSPGVEPEPPPPWGDMKPIWEQELQPDHDSFLFARHLAYYISDPSKPEGLRQQARNILRSWIRFDSEVPDDNARHWREMLWDHAHGSGDVPEPEQREILKLLCEEGWMMPVDMEERISRAESIAWDYVLDQPVRSRAFLTMLALIRQSGASHGEWGLQLVRLVDEEFDFQPNEEKGKAMMAMWNSVRGQSLSCESLLPMDIL